jgi:hypothetical protein
MTSLFRALHHHICVVVRESDKSVDYYESIGIGPFVEYPARSEYRENLQVPTPEAFAQSSTCRSTSTTSRSSCASLRSWTAHNVAF